MSGNPNCEHCGGTGEIRVKGCTCGGIDIGVGVMHEPGCGLEQCACWHRASAEEIEDECD